MDDLLPTRFRETFNFISKTKEKFHNDIRDPRPGFFAYIRQRLAEIDLNRRGIFVDIPHQPNLMASLILIALVDTDCIDPQDTVAVCTKSSEGCLAILGDIDELLIAIDSRVPSVVSIFSGPAVRKCLVVWSVGQSHFMKPGTDVVQLRDRGVQLKQADRV